MSGMSNRITIQLDLSGYSFKVYDRGGNVLSAEKRSCPLDLSVKELVPFIDTCNGAITVVFSTWKYTMVPLSNFDASRAKDILSELKDLDANDRILTQEIPGLKAVMIYAVSSDIYDELAGLSKNIQFYSISYILIDRLSSIEQNNRVVISFSDGMLHIAVAERERMMFVNTFPVRDVATAEYFIMSVIKEMPFNPEHTHIYIWGEANTAAVAELEKYFPKVLNIQ